MYSIIRVFVLLSLWLTFSLARAQSYELSPPTAGNSLEIGILNAYGEAEYVGLYAKFSKPLTHGKHYLSVGAAFTTYFDFVGESGVNSRLQKDVDARFIPAIFLAGQVNFGRFSGSLETHLGSSIAHTRGTLVNNNIGFTGSYRNTEIFWHYGLGSSLKYMVKKGHSLGIYGFLPMVKDVAWSLPTIGIGWTRAWPNKK